VIPRGFTAKPGVGFGIGAIKGSYTAGSCPAVSEKLHRSCSLQRDTCTLEEQSAISEESRLGLGVHIRVLCRLADANRASYIH
jgi:hypothetical protein